MIFPAFGFNIGTQSLNVSAQNRVNLYCDIQSENDKTIMAIYRTAGLTSFNSNGGSNPYRGTSNQIGNFFYGVKSGTFYQIDNTGTETVRGMINTTSGNVCISDNGAQILIVDGVNGYVYTIATTTLTQIVSANFPNGATTCAFQGGFFIVDDPAHTGRWYKSASYDGLTWAALDFATAESNPDALVRVWVNNGVIHLFGTNTLEFWGNTGALDFPFSLIQGSPIEWGLGAKWSVAKLMGSTAFLAQNILGHVQIVLLNGFTPIPISSSDVDAELDTYSNVADAVALSYMLNGHQFYEISFPSVGKTWLYDATSSQQAGVPVWSRLTSNNGRHLANFYINYIGRNLVTDYSSGNIYNLQEGVYTDNGAMIPWKLTSKHVFDNNKMVSIGRLWVDFETGVGLTSGQGSNPQVMLRYSKDGGHTWSAELWQTLGALGTYLTRVIWRRLGRARDWVFELTGTDAVKITIMNAGFTLRTGRE